MRKLKTIALAAVAVIGLTSSANAAASMLQTNEFSLITEQLEGDLNKK